MYSKMSVFVTAGCLLATVTLCGEAQGAGGGASPSCLVENASGPTISGIVGVTVLNYDGSNGDVDATLRLQRQGKEKFFRVHLSGVPILSAEDLACQILAAQPLDDNFQTIFDAFGLDPAKGLVITSRSLSGMQFAPIPLSGDPTHFSALANITLHVGK
jgi:hypothetical protein